MKKENIFSFQTEDNLDENRGCLQSFIWSVYKIVDICSRRSAFAPTNNDFKSERSACYVRVFGHELIKFSIDCNIFEFLQSHRFLSKQALIVYELFEHLKSPM